MKGLTQHVIVALACSAAFLSVSSTSSAEDATIAPVTAASESSTTRAIIDAISRYLSLPIKEISRKKLPVQLSDTNISRVSPEEEGTKVALAIVESDISPEILLSRSEDEAAYVINFAPGAVLIRSSAPRYDSLANGIEVMFSPVDTKIALFEGKRDSSVLFLAPPVSECGTQFVLACPRKFSGAQELVPSGYTVTGARYVVSGKADGLFRPPAASLGKVSAQFLGSAGIQVPAENTRTSTDATAPRATLHATKGSFQQGMIRAALPFEEFFEARLEFGTPDKVLRTSWARSTVIVGQFDLATPREVPVENSIVTLQPGPCYIIAQTKASRF